MTVEIRKGKAPSFTPYPNSSGKRKLAPDFKRLLPRRLFLVIDLGERLPVGVVDDEASVVVVFDRPRRREAARVGHGADKAR